MSYYANSNTITISKERIPLFEKMKKELPTNISKYLNCFDIDCDGNGNLMVSYDGNWYDDECGPIALEIVKISDENSFAFDGEDGCRWRYYRKKDGTVVEQNGEIVYRDIDFHHQNIDQLTDLFQQFLTANLTKEDLSKIADKVIESYLSENK